MSKAKAGRLFLHWGDPSEVRVLSFPRQESIKVRELLLASGEGRKDDHFSFSHSADRTFVLIYPKSWEKMAIDVERCRTLSANAAHLFLSDAELAQATRLPLLQLWCIKEALYKVHSSQGGLDLFDFELENPGAGQGSAQVKHMGTIHYFNYASHHGPEWFWALAWQSHDVQKSHKVMDLARCIHSEF